MSKKYKIKKILKRNSSRVMLKKDRVSKSARMVMKKLRALKRSLLILDFIYKGRGLQHIYMMAFQQMGEKNYYFFFDVPGFVTNEDFSDAVETLLHSINYLNVLRYLRLLNNPFFIIRNVFIGEFFVSFIDDWKRYEKREIFKTALNKYFKSGHKLGFLDVFYYSNTYKMPLFLSFLLKDLIYFLYRIWGLSRIGEVSKKILNLVYKTWFERCYAFMSFQVLGDDVIGFLVKDYVKVKDEEAVKKKMFIPESHLNAKILRVVKVKLPFNVSYDKIRFLGMSGRSALLVKRYFFLKEKFILIFKEFRQKHFSFKLQLRAVSFLMLELTQAKDYILGSIIGELSYIYRIKMGRLLFLLRWQRILIDFSYYRRKYSRGKTHRVSSVGNYDKEKLLLGHVSGKMIKFREKGCNNIANLRKYVNDYNLIMKNVNLSKQRRKLKPLKYRTDASHMLSYINRFVFGISLDLVFLNFLKNRKLKKLRLPVVSLERNGLFSNFVFLAELKNLWDKTGFFRTVEKLNIWCNMVGLTPISWKIYDLGVSPDLNNVMIGKRNSALFSNIPMKNIYIVCLFFGSVTPQHIFSLVRYNKYILSKLNIKTIVMFFCNIIYIFVLCLFVLLGNAGCRRIELLSLIMEVLFYGTLLFIFILFIFLKYLNVIYIILVLSLLSLSFSFIVYIATKFIFKNVVLRLLLSSKLLIKMILLSLTSYRHLYFGLISLDHSFLKRYKILGNLSNGVMTVLSLLVYMRENSMWTLISYHMVKSFGISGCLHLIVHVVRKLLFFRGNLSAVFVGRYKLRDEILNPFYFHPILNMFLLNGGFSYVYRYFNDYFWVNVRCLEDALKEEHKLYVFTKFFFYKIGSLVFGIVMILLLLMRQLLILFVYFFVRFYTAFMIYINLGFDHIKVFFAFRGGKLMKSLLLVILTLLMFVQHLCRVIHRGLFRSNIKYLAGNSMLWRILNWVNLSGKPMAVVNINFIFKFCFIFFAKPGKKRVWLHYFPLVVKTGSKSYHYHHYTGAGLRQLGIDLLFYEFNVINLMFRKLKVFKLGMFILAVGPEICNRFINIVVRVLYLVIRLYYNLVLKHMNNNIVFLNYLYSVRDQLGVVNGILLTQLGFPFWGRGRAFFPSLKFNRRFFLFSSLIQLFRDFSYGTVNFYSFNYYTDFYFANLVFFGDILWTRYRVDFSSVFKFLSKETMINYFRDFYHYSILPFNLFKMRSNVLFFVDVSSVFNYFLDSYLVLNSNMRVDLTKKPVGGFAYVFNFLRLFVSRVFFVFGFITFFAFRVFKYFFIILLGIFVYLPTVFMVVGLVFFIKLLHRLFWKFYDWLKDDMANELPILSEELKEKRELEKIERELRRRFGGFY